MSIDEVRTVGRIINENRHLKTEIDILNSNLIANDKHIFLLQSNVSSYRSITEQQASIILNFEEIDRTRVQQISDMQNFHKKDKRATALKFCGGGIAIGMILMLLLN